MKTQKIKKEKSARDKASVKIFTTSSCPWCSKAKEFLRENGIEYQEINVGEDEKARNEMFEKSGQFGVPVIDVGGQIIVGFNVDALKKSLKI